MDEVIKGIKFTWAEKKRIWYYHKYIMRCNRRRMMCTGSMLRRSTRSVAFQTFISVPFHRNFSIQHPTKREEDTNQEDVAVLGHDKKFKEYGALLNECVNHKYIRGGQTVQAQMIKNLYLRHAYLGGRLIVFYLKCGSLDDARMVFDEMPHRTVVSWTAMVSGYTKAGLYSQALHLFLQMLRSGTSPNEFTFATVLTSCTAAYSFGYGRQIHSLVVKSPFESHLYVGSSLLDLYAKSGEIREARAVFEGLPERDVVSCTAIISGYAQLGFDEEALRLFSEFQNEGMTFNYVTYACVLTALSGLAAFEHGRQLHGHLLRSRLSSYVIIQNSLIDMYSKCGNLLYSRRIFDRMHERTVSSWNVMLGGYSKHGNGEAVVELYEKMREDDNVNADSTTLLTVLSVCSHGGMEQTGLGFFNEMASNNAIDLGIQHYGCVVDLLGRGGQLEKALQFIKEMPIEPNPAIWGSLLGACRAHKNFQVGKIAGDRLLDIEPENGGNYVMLCNLYASDGRWHEVRKVRELMREKVVKKEPGKSWITVGRTLRTFYAGDRPENEEMLRKVSELSDRIKGFGYAPDLISVLHDVEDEQKEKMLLGHSEKLALAFGMMNVCEGKAIRIMKNLRICVDCHSFAKFVSQVYRRELLIRDKSRFHHIVNGICSCRDYW